MRTPKVSIIIPVYNGSNFLKDAIDTALSQTYQNLEIIVVNDGSTDNGKTEEIALTYGDRIRYFSKPNGGVSSALNYGIRKMTGEYFSWLSHDDLYLPNKVKDSIELLGRYNQLGKKCIAFTGGCFVDAEGFKIKNFKKIFLLGKRYSGQEVVRSMTQKGTLYGCSLLIPKFAFDDVGYFDETLRFSQDSLMWYRLFLADYSLVSDNAPNVMCRLHKNQVTHLRRDLYEHDAVVIAKLLAESLASIGNDGHILFLYIKRLTKYQCREAIDYLYSFGAQKGCLSLSQRVLIRFFDFIGFFRYRIVNVLKKVLIRLRH